MNKAIKFLCLALCLVLLITAGACKNNNAPTVNSEDSSSDFSEPSSENGEPSDAFSEKTNPLTGLDTLEEGEAGLMPVAVMVNNIGIAQSVQAGVDSADVVFETLVEGGITRLMAMYKAPKEAMGKIGSVRSARVVYAELASSMNALYFHCGQDQTYYPSRAKELGLRDVNVDAGKYGERINNGKPSEHTLYTSGGEMKKAVENSGYTSGNEAKPWLDFSADRPACANRAEFVKVKFSNVTTSTFTYDAQTDSYVRGVGVGTLKNYFNGNEARFTNVFVLFTHTEAYPDNLHVKVELNGGDGFYITKGGYEKITWEKSGDSSPLSFKTESGEVLKVTPGNSYICIADKDMSGYFSAE